MPIRRLRAESDIRAVFASRSAEHGSAMTVRSRRRGDTAPGRAAVTAGRRVGGAVQRNRAKRRLRAALATATVPPGTDVVIVARPATLTVSFGALTAELSDLLARVALRGQAGAT
ncbi:MAG: ribonuclease P protein component [Actinomycetota bacterium]|nr:ribonuclease P protein component [Actinomycetota bacterium]